MTIEEIYRHTIASLTQKFGAAEARALTIEAIETLKGWTLTDILTRGDAETTPWLSEQMEKIVARLLNDEPLQYILGKARFHGLQLKVTPATLIPRPETSQLVDIITDRLGDTSDLHILDIGTGSGAIAIALARTLRFPMVDAIDVSSDALAVARENASACHAIIKFTHADILATTLPADTYDLIVSNPPYITESERTDMDVNVLDYEPHTALFVPDADPLRFYRRIATLALSSLHPGGLLAFEINRTQADSMRDLLESSGFGNVDILRDSFGNYRFALATAPLR